MRRVTMLCAAAALSACATTPPPGAPVPLPFRSVQSHFEAGGRLAARNGEQAVHGKFTWQHAPERDRWDFFSPLGQVVARLNRDGRSATLVTADGSEIVEPIESLLARMLGMAVPVAALPRWIQAGVAASEDVREFDALGRPARIVDDGWQVRYLAYASPAPDARPSSLEVSRGEARLKLVIDSWQ